MQCKSYKCAKIGAIFNLSILQTQFQRFPVDVEVLSERIRNIQYYTYSFNFKNPESTTFIVNPGAVCCSPAWLCDLAVRWPSGPFTCFVGAERLNMVPEIHGSWCQCVASWFQSLCHVRPKFLSSNRDFILLLLLIFMFWLFICTKVNTVLQLNAWLCGFTQLAQAVLSKRGRVLTQQLEFAGSKIRKAQHGRNETRIACDFLF